MSADTPADEPQVFRLHGIGFGDGAFDPRDVDPALLLVDIVALEQRHFGSPQPMMIGQLKQGAVALAVMTANSRRTSSWVRKVISGSGVASWCGSMNPTVYLLCRIPAIGPVENAHQTS